MKAVVNKEENRTKAAIGSALFHALLLALLFFYVHPAPDITPEVSTIELNFGGGGDNAAAGEPDKGMNDDYTPPGEEPAPSTPEKATSTPAPTPTKAQPAAPPTTSTSDDPDVAAIKQQKEQDSKKREEADRQEAARQNEVNRQREAAEAAQRAEQAKRDKVKNNAVVPLANPAVAAKAPAVEANPATAASTAVREIIRSAIAVEPAAVPAAGMVPELVRLLAADWVAGQ